MHAKKLIAPLCICSALALSGCSFHLRSASSWPIALRIVTLQAPDLPEEAQSTFNGMLHSMHVQQSAHAAYRLQLSQYSLTQEAPTTVTNNLPITVKLDATLRYSVIMRNGNVCIPSTTIAATYTQTEPGTQVLSTNIDPDVRTRLVQDLSQQLYAQITSSNTRELLASPACKPGNKP